jgi:hypothetical protein
VSEQTSRPANQTVSEELESEPRLAWELNSLTMLHKTHLGGFVLFVRSGLTELGQTRQNPRTQLGSINTQIAGLKHKAR